MPQIINTNIASLNAQRNLDRSQNDANVAFQRLSSGLRINSAKDDAAGLAISTRFQSQISGLNVAQRNANDGISLAQTAEGALDEVVNNLQRIRELAVQSANATNSKSDREALDNEVQQRIAEIDRIASQTSFNGLKVLDGSFETETFQVGANAGDTISVDLSQGSRAGDIGELAVSASLSIPADTETLEISVSGGDPVVVTAEGAETIDSILSKINSAGATGIYAIEDPATAGNILILSAEDFSVGVNGAVATDYSVDTGGDGSFLKDVAIDTVEGANQALLRVDAALTSINGIRSELGAVQNRFESTIANLSTTSENLSAANSRIRDADFAKETAELSRTQVLQQAGMSVLSQANAQPQNVLQLLQG